MRGKTKPFIMQKKNSDKLAKLLGKLTMELELYEKKVLMEENRKKASAILPVLYALLP
jgi:hypothetical protein